MTVVGTGMPGWSGADVARTPFTYSLIAKIKTSPVSRIIQVSNQLVVCFLLEGLAQKYVYFWGD